MVKLNIGYVVVGAITGITICAMVLGHDGAIINKAMDTYPTPKYPLASPIYDPKHEATSYSFHSRLHKTHSTTNP